MRCAEEDGMQGFGCFVYANRNVNLLYKPIISLIECNGTKSFNEHVLNAIVKFGSYSIISNELLYVFPHSDAFDP